MDSTPPTTPPTLHPACWIVSNTTRNTQACSQLQDWRPKHQKDLTPNQTHSRAPAKTNTQACIHLNFNQFLTSSKSAIEPKPSQDSQIHGEPCWVLIAQGATRLLAVMSSIYQSTNQSINEDAKLAMPKGHSRPSSTRPLMNGVTQPHAGQPYGHPSYRRTTGHIKHCSIEFKPNAGNGVHAKRAIQLEP